MTTTTNTECVEEIKSPDRPPCLFEGQDEGYGLWHPEFGWLTRDGFGGNFRWSRSCDCGAHLFEDVSELLSKLADHKAPLTPGSQVYHVRKKETASVRFCDWLDKDERVALKWNGFYITDSGETTDDLNKAKLFENCVQALRFSHGKSGSLRDRSLIPHLFLLELVELTREVEIQPA